MIFVTNSLITNLKIHFGPRTAMCLQQTTLFSISTMCRVCQENLYTFQERGKNCIKIVILSLYR